MKTIFIDSDKKESFLSLFTLTISQNNIPYVSAGDLYFSKDEMINFKYKRLYSHNYKN